MIFMFEGMDNCLKDAIIMLLRGHIPPETQVLKFSNPPEEIDDAELYQKKHFADMFNFLSLSIAHSQRNLILNRAHLGEYVYSPIYRKYNANWIFELEREYLKNSDCARLTILILLYDSNNEQLKLREDGRSLSQAKEIKFNAEREKFIEAFDKSLFVMKIKFDLSEYYIESLEPKKTVDTKAILKKILALSSGD